MKHPSILVFFLLSILKLSAQTAPGIDWERCIPNASVKSIVAISDSVFYVAFESLSCTDSSAIGLRSYDSQGSLLWEKMYVPPSTQSYHIFSLIHSQNNFLLSGSIDSAGVSFNRVLKTDEAGTILKDVRWFLSDTAKVNFNKINEDGAGGFVFAGETFTSNHRDLLISNLDGNLNSVWQVTYGGSLFEHARDIIPSSGNYLVAAYSNSLDGDVVGNHGKNDVWLIKLDATGSVVWKKCFGGTKNEEVRSVIEVNDGYVISAMSQSSNDQVSIHHGSNVYYDYWIFKVDFSGNLIWDKTFGGTHNDYASQMISLADGNFLVTGSSYSVNNDVNDHHGSSVFDDQWTIKMTPSGTMIWQKSTGGTYDDWSLCAASLDSQNTIIAGGSIASDGDHQDACYSNDCRVMNGGWIVKLSNQCASNVASLFSYVQNGKTLTFQNQSTNAISYHWDFGDGNSSTDINPTHVYTNNGEYTVCLDANDSCGSKTYCVTIKTCTALPVANFTITYSGGVDIAFTDGSSNAVEWQWDFGDGGFASITNPTHSYNQNGTYTVTLTVTDSCNNISSVQHSVNTCLGFTTDFSYSSNGNTVTFSDLSAGLADSWSWDFGDGNFSSLQNPSHTYSALGTYNVCLTSSATGCSPETTCYLVTVCAPAIVNSFTYSATSTSVAFFDWSTNATSWQWDFGDGNSSAQQNPSHTYSQSGNYTVCEIASNTCSSDTFCDQITVTCPSLNALFTYNSNYLSLSFIDQTGTATSWQWTFGDGNTSSQQSPSHTFSQSGDYTICLMVNDGCSSDTFCELIHVSCPPLDAAFTFNANNLNVLFSDQSVTATSWQWTFGDGNTSSQQNPSYAYLQSGDYTVCLIVSDGCSSDTSCQTIHVNCPAFSAQFSFTENSGSVSFTDLSANANQWSWDFGDGGTSTLQNPVHLYTANGTFDVCLTASDGCSSDTLCDSVSIIGAGIAALSAAEIPDIFPNPSTGQAVVEFNLSQPSLLTLTLYDVAGRELNILFSGMLMEGKKSIPIHLDNLSPGTYLLEIKTSESIYVGKVVKE